MSLTLPLPVSAWHRASREVLEEAYPDGGFVLLTRSGFTGEHRVAQVVWAGDQEANWTETDGLPTDEALRAAQLELARLQLLTGRAAEAVRTARSAAAASAWAGLRCSPCAWPCPIPSPGRPISPDATP